MSCLEVEANKKEAREGCEESDGRRNRDASSFEDDKIRWHQLGDNDSQNYINPFLKCRHQPDVCFIWSQFDQV